MVAIGSDRVEQLGLVVVDLEDGRHGGGAGNGASLSIWSSPRSPWRPAAWGVGGDEPAEFGAPAIQAAESREVVHGSKCKLEREAITGLESLL
jgi:hypothetical protein